MMNDNPNGRADDDYVDDNDDDDDDDADDDDADDEDADDDVGHLLSGEKGLDSNLLSSPASKPYFAISEIIKIIMVIQLPHIGLRHYDDDENGH